MSVTLQEIPQDSNKDSNLCLGNSLLFRVSDVFRPQKWIANVTLEVGTHCILQKRIYPENIEALQSCTHVKEAL